MYKKAFMNRLHQLATESAICLLYEYSHLLIRFRIYVSNDINHRIEQRFSGLFSLRINSVFPYIADFDHRFDMTAGIAQRSTQLPDMCIDSTVTAFVIHAPYAVKDLISA